MLKEMDAKPRQTESLQETTTRKPSNSLNTDDRPGPDTASINLRPTMSAPPALMFPPDHDRLIKRTNMDDIMEDTVSNYIFVCFYYVTFNHLNFSIIFFNLALLRIRAL